MGRRMGLDGAKVHSVFALERPEAAGDILFVCEHASNKFPAPFGALGLDAATRRAHVAWDPGALGLARGLAERLDGTLIHATASRLLYDLNRPPHSPGAMPAKSELFEIPGNAAVTPSERLKRTETFYLPFVAALHDEVARRLAMGRRPVIVTIHSFTPVYFGQPRAVEFGIIHDADPSYARAIHAAALAQGGLDARLNEPYSASDGVTHTLRHLATPYDLDHAMLEIRNDLIATPEDERRMADRLAPVLRSALAELQRGRHRTDVG